MPHSLPAQGRLRTAAAHHARLVFLAGLALGYWLALFGSAGIDDDGHAGRTLVRLAACAVELWFVGLLLAGCMRMASSAGRWRTGWILLSWLVAGLACLGYLAQAYSLHLSGNFLTALALQNGDSAAFIASRRLAAAVILALLWWLGFCASTLLPRPQHAARPLNGEWLRRGAYLGSLAAATLLMAYLSTLQRKAPALEPGFRQTPLAALAVAAHDASQQVQEAPAAASGHTDACFAWPAKDGEFPFQKADIYRKRLERAAGAPSGPPNMIVLMSEGVSAGMLGAYGGPYPGLTPNIDRIARDSMRVDNYFNHTAATYRGVGGQMFSGFAASGGAGKNGWERVSDPGALATTRRQTVPALLASSGWDTYFLAPHREDKPFILMLRSIGFEHVYSMDTINRDLVGSIAPTRGRTQAMEDQSLFEGLEALLSRRLSSGNRRPFFLALYNIGTHAMIPPGPVSFDGHDNPVLDKLHNYDASIGQFLDWFEHSEYADNTTLVFTADHATYPEPAYRKVAYPGFRPYFVDRIPLLVRDPFHRLPATLDAEGRNSLGLAPTLLQLLEAPQAQNSFLGRSLFEPRSMPLGIAWTSPGRYFLTTSEGVRSHGQIPPPLAQQFGCEQELVRRYLQAEAEDRIFDPELRAPAVLPR